jgi:hypothetical protein
MLVSRPLTATKRFYATCPSDTAEGDFVQLTGETIGGVYQVESADVGESTPGVAIVVQKITGTECLIQMAGEQIKNVFTGLEPGRLYFIGNNSRPSLTPPVPTTLQPRVYVQPVGVALSSDVLDFRNTHPVSIRVL